MLHLSNHFFKKIFYLSLGIFVCSGSAWAADPISVANPQIYADLQLETLEASAHFSRLMLTLSGAPYDENKDFEFKVTPIFNYVTRAGQNVVINLGNGNGTELVNLADTKTLDAGINFTVIGRMDHRWSIAGSFQYDYLNLNVGDVTDGTQDGSSNNVNLGLTLAYTRLSPFKKHPKDRLYAQAFMTYTGSFAKGERVVSHEIQSQGYTISPAGTVTAHPFISLFRFGAETGYGFAVKDTGLELGPYAHIDVGISRMDSFSETGFQDARYDYHMSPTWAPTGKLMMGGRLHWELKKKIASERFRNVMQKLTQDSRPVPLETFEEIYDSLKNNVVIDMNLAWQGEMSPPDIQLRGTSIAIPWYSDALAYSHDMPGLGGIAWGAGIQSNYNVLTFSLRYEGSYAAPGAQLSNGFVLSGGLAF